MTGRLLFLITSLAYGGAEIQVKDLSLRLQQRGWDVGVVSMCPPEALVDELKQGGVFVESLDMPRGRPDPRGVLKLGQLIRQHRSQIIHSHMVHANLLARVTHPLVPGRIWLCTAHNIDEGGRSRELAYRLTDPLCDLTTQVSKAGLERYVAIGAAPRRKIIVMPNGVDAQRFHPDAAIRARLRDSMHLDGHFVWLSIGRLEESKDYPTLLRAFALVVKDYPQSRLLIAGQGDLRPLLENLQRELGLEGSIEFLGVRKDVPDLMNVADGFVISSAWEGLPMVLLEAAATALPLVATDVGGVSEIVIDGKNGFLRPSQDAAALAEAMMQVMSLSPSQQMAMGRASRELIETTYELDGVVTKWETLYRALMQGDRSVIQEARGI